MIGPAAADPGCIYIVYQNKKKGQQNKKVQD